MALRANQIERCCRQLSPEKADVAAFAGELARAGGVKEHFCEVVGDLRCAIIEGCGHFVPKVKPKELVAILASFLESNHAVNGPAKTKAELMRLDQHLTRTVTHIQQPWRWPIAVRMRHVRVLSTCSSSSRIAMTRARLRDAAGAITS